KQDAYWARTVGAARSGDAASARKNFEKYKDLSRAGNKSDEYGDGSHQRIEEQEAEAWVNFAEGKQEEAVKLMRSAADAEDADRVDLLSMPAREMLGDLLLELHQPEQALAAYAAALTESPNRFDGLYGAARAAQMAGKTEEARNYYTK